MAAASTIANAVTTRAPRAEAVNPSPKIVDLAPAGQMALDLTSPAGLMSLSEADRIVAAKRFEAIEPLVDRDKFRLLWLQFQNRTGAVVEFLTAQHGAKRRTLYEWLKRFERDGIAGLADRGRNDKARGKFAAQLRGGLVSNRTRASRAYQPLQFSRGAPVQRVKPRTAGKPGEDGFNQGA